MSLQGTLDTFPLDDVLQLLAGTRKSGRLEVSGPHVAGSVWMVDGAVVAAVTTSLPPTSPVTETVFEILSFREGAFAFEADVAHPDAGPPVPVEVLLAQWEAEQRSLVRPDAWVTLTREAPAAHVVLSADEWRLVAAIGGGIKAGAVAARLGARAMDTARALRHLLDTGLAVLAEGPEPAQPPGVPGSGVPAAGPAHVSPPHADPVPAWPAAAMPDAEPTVDVRDLDPMAAEVAPASWPAPDGHPSAPIAAPASPAEPRPEATTVHEAAIAPPQEPAPPAPRSPELGGDLGIVIPGFDSLTGESPLEPPESGPLVPNTPARAVGAREQAVETAAAEAPGADATPGAGEAEEVPPDRELLLRYLSSVKR